MQDYGNRISQKHFLEQVEEFTRSMQRQDLVHFILYYAEQIASGGRQAFLDQLYSFSGTGKVTTNSPSIDDMILSLKEDIQQRFLSVEDGTYFHHGGPQWYDDEDEDEYPGYLSSEQISVIASLYKKADNLFTTGEIFEAERIYRQLFEIFTDHSDSFTDIPIDRRETKARYYRCIYETAEPANRASLLYEALRQYEHAVPISSCENEYAGPGLADIENTRYEPLDHKQQFLVQWIDLLSRYETSLSVFLLLEAVFLQQGEQGLSCFVRTWQGAKQSWGYVFWLRRVKNTKNYSAMIPIAQEAWSVLPYCYARGLTAAELIAAAQHLDDPPLVLSGKRELFFSHPKKLHLSSLLQEADTLQQRKRELETVREFMGKHLQEEKHLCLRIIVFVLSGLPVHALADRTGVRPEELRAEDLPMDTLGWTAGVFSQCPTGLLFSAVLCALVKDRIDSAAVIKKMLKRYAFPQVLHHDSSYPMHLSTDKPYQLLYNYLIEGIQDSVVQPDEKEMLVHWAETIGTSRVHAIVSNKYRGSYDKAAEILWALAECFLLTGNPSKAHELIHTFRNEIYFRYSAFRRALDRAADNVICR